MMEHEDLRSAIPAFVAGRIDPETKRVLEEHLESCSSCAETVDVAKEIVRVMESGGEVLFSDHPSPARIRALATGSAGEESGSLSAHVAVCPSCGLEVESWEARLAAPSERGPASARSAIGGRPMLVGLAAGLVLGIGLSALYFIRQSGSWRLGGPNPGGTSSGSWGGAVHLNVLELPSRSASGVQRIQIDPRAPVTLMDVPAEIDLGGAAGTMFVIEILGEDGAPAWAQELTGKDLSERIDPRSSLLPIVVPTDVLRSGPWVLVIRKRITEGEPLVRIPFGVQR